MIGLQALQADLLVRTEQPRCGADGELVEDLRVRLPRAPGSGLVRLSESRNALLGPRGYGFIDGRLGSGV